VTYGDLPEIQNLIHEKKNQPKKQKTTYVKAKRLVSGAILFGLVAKKLDLG